jgi:hypothetical protein
MTNDIQNNKYFFKEYPMKAFFSSLFQPLSAETPKTFHLRHFFYPTSLPFQLWDRMFKIPMLENLRKFIPGMKNPPKQEDEKGQAGEKRNGRRMKIQVEVFAYPLRPNVSDIPLRGDLKNLCPNGVCVEFLKTVDENHMFLLDFKLTDEKIVRRPARVVWSRNRLSGFELLNANDAREIMKESQLA